MSWRAAWCAIVCLAALGLCIHGTLAQNANDSDDDDDDLEFESAGRPVWHRYVDSIFSKKPGLDFLTGGMPDRLIYFTGIDVWRYGVGGYTGFQWAPDGIYKDGFILRAAISSNYERFTTRKTRYINDISRGSLMAGLRFSRYRADLQLLAGFEGQADLQLVNGRLAKPRARFGTRFTTDFWWEPTPLLMLHASLSGSTIDDALSMRAAGGWRLDDRFWVGPEVSQSRDYFSTQTRLGVHLTGLRTGPYEWTIAGGHIADSFGRGGVYGRLGILLRPPRPSFFEN